MPYPENFVVRLLISIVGMVAIWLGASYISHAFITHKEFTVGVIDIVAPLALGVVEAFLWKPKDQK